jgi:hypothetical protein
LQGALVTFLDEQSAENALAAQAKSSIVAGAEQSQLSCQKVDAEKAASSTGSFGKTWRKGKAKASNEVGRLLALEAPVRIHLCISLLYCIRFTPCILSSHAFVNKRLQGDSVVDSALLKKWQEPVGPRALTVMELSEDLDSMTKVRCHY